MTNQEAFLKQLHKVNLEYQKEMLFVLTHIYHLTLHESLSICDLQSLGERYNLDVSKEYNRLMNTLEDGEDD